MLRIFFITLLKLFFFELTRCNDIQLLHFRMPNVHPDKADLYLCYQHEIGVNETLYITGYEPHASMDVAHHIAIYGCTTPAKSEPVYVCGLLPESKFPLPAGDVCESGSELLFAWARDAPSMHLPEGVGLKIGKGSTIKYLVLQVHYVTAEPFKDGTPDNTGIDLLYSREPTSKVAGIFTLGSDGSIPPHSVEHMDISCVMTENKILHPFAYRAHTHTLGRVVAGYLVKYDNGNDTWFEIGKRNPLEAETFESSWYQGVIKPGDILAARCTMESNRDTVTVVGVTDNDEMCNLYIMYYVENDEPLENSYCYGAGPPAYYWKNDNFHNIPDEEASTL
ncbi:hypothetical protein QAD02_006034 [Eretmocerus hayati]|uniref:Uncharacterized protein n=1 Tax=Eretmocerus hayati TaxID=131215 RepID=A0ACC2N064_9HYME|nr:hypothetical protein QAD02_006034 [Eretmocerus hayati]